MEVTRNIYGTPATDDRVPLHTSDRGNRMRRCPWRWIRDA
jgi:hypothetical protein